MPGGGTVDVDELLPPTKKHKKGDQTGKSIRNGSHLGRVSSQQGEDLEVQGLMSKPQFLAVEAAGYGPRVRKGVSHGGMHKKDHSLKWIEVGNHSGVGYISCDACKGSRVQKKSVVQHIIGPSHLENLKVWTKSEANKAALQKCLHQVAREEQVVGQSFSGELKLFQLTTLEEIYRSNITTNSFQGIADHLDKHLIGEKRIGHVKDLTERWKSPLYNFIVKRNCDSELLWVIVADI